MKQAQFITLMSDCLRVEEKTIKKIVRTLREAGLFTTGARGVNAPDMTSLDAVRVFIAAVASTSPSRAVHDVLYFGEMVPDLRGNRPDDTAELKITHETTLAQFLVSIVEDKAPADCHLFGSLRVSEIDATSVSVGGKKAIYQEFCFEGGYSKSKNILGNQDCEMIWRSSECALTVLHEVGFHMIGWEVD